MLFKSSPLIQSLKFLSFNPKRSVSIFYGVLFCIVLLCMSINFFPSAQKIAMRKFHLTLRPFSIWALWQFVPSMYNFHNELFVTTEPLPLSLKGRDGQEVLHFSVNHYPLRMIYFTSSRRSAFMSPSLYLYLRSVYRQEEITTSYLIQTRLRPATIIFLNSYERSSQ